MYLIFGSQKKNLPSFEVQSLRSGFWPQNRLRNPDLQKMHSNRHSLRKRNIKSAKKGNKDKLSIIQWLKNKLTIEINKPADTQANRRICRLIIKISC